MPWTGVPDLTTARRVVEAANQPNGGVLVDALHFARSGSTFEQLAQVPRQYLHYAQICDGPAAAPATTEGLIHAARCERLLPGDGGLPLVELWAKLPPDLPVSVEIPNHAGRERLGPDGWARQAWHSSLLHLVDQAIGI